MSVKISKQIAKKFASYGFEAKDDEDGFTIVTMADGTFLTKSESGSGAKLFDMALEAREAMDGDTTPQDDVDADADIVEQEERDPADDELEAANDELDAEDEKKFNVVPKKYRDEYKARGDASCCCDSFSRVFKEATSNGKATDVIALGHIGNLNDIDIEAKWGKLNVGMRRMNLGNMLRTRLKKVGVIKWPNATGELTAAAVNIALATVE